MAAREMCHIRKMSKGNTMKRFQKVIAGFLSLFVLLALIFFAGRYGWRVLGFRACRGAGIESVTVGDHAVEIKGFSPGSFPEGFCGYYSEERDGKLYVGFRFSTVFGFFEAGNFDVTVPTQGRINQVILKTQAAEISIWAAEDYSAAADESCGVYIRLERDDADMVFLKYNAAAREYRKDDGTALKTGEWFFTGGDIARLSGEENRSILFTVGARGADGTLLAESAFLYDAAREKLYVTISGEGVTCGFSDAPGMADVPPAPTRRSCGPIRR